jgi:hypothetical protein
MLFLTKWISLSLSCLNWLTSCTILCQSPVLHIDLIYQLTSCFPLDFACHSIYSPFIFPLQSCN